MWSGFLAPSPPVSYSCYYWVWMQNMMQYIHFSYGIGSMFCWPTAKNLIVELTWSSYISRGDCIFVLKWERRRGLGCALVLGWGCSGPVQVVGISMSHHKLSQPKNLSTWVWEEHIILVSPHFSGWLRVRVRSCDSQGKQNTLVGKKTEVWNRPGGLWLSWTTHPLLSRKNVCRKHPCLVSVVNER